MALIDDVKKQLRITTSEFDTEVNGLIDAAKKDLETVGVYSIDENDPLIKNAIILYAKANFGYDNPEADRFQETYENIKNKISMLTDYVYHKVTINALEQCEVIFDGKLKETDINGEVLFYSREKNHVPYKIGDNEIKYIDVTGDITISE